MTNPASETDPKDRQSRLLSNGFCNVHLIVYHSVTTSYHLPGLVHLDNFILTLNFSAICRDFAKTTQ